MFSKVLIANRGEIAVRIVRTLREMDIGSVAVYSEADRDALFVQEADEAYRLGPPPAAQSYLDSEAILSIARQAGAQAIHSGYGFLAENVPFVQAVIESGIVWIGPPVEAMRLMGDKVEARRTVEPLGVPLVPGTPGPVTSLGEAIAFAASAGYPVAVKAAGGGGGRGIRVVREEAEMADALEGASREALAYFKNPEVYLERYYANPRHVEIQVLGDTHGNLIHLGERDCSTQRRHQKLIEESPGPAVDRALRTRMGEAALRAARSVSYHSAGTVEFLLNREGEFYFLEMNTRIQVEHPVTERVTGVDLIREMILVAAGEPLTVRESFLDLDGHAIEVRINAEDVRQGFRPTPTTITSYREPGGPGVRLDSGVYAGFTIPSEYDSLMAKLTVWAPHREAARRRALRALGEFRIEGPCSTISLAKAILETPVFTEGEIGTTYVESHLDALLAAIPDEAPVVQAEQDGRRREAERTFDVEVNRKRFTVRLAEIIEAAGPATTQKRRTTGKRAVQSNVLASPMHGTVIAIRKAIGDSVAEGEPLFVIEAMKMENEVAAHRGGTLAAIEVAIGETVETDQQLAIIDD